MTEDWKLNHVGLVTRDYDIPLGYYQTTGMGVTVGPQIAARDFDEQWAGETKFFMDEKLPRLNGGSGPGRPADPEPRPPAGSRRGTYGFMDKNCQVGTLLFEFLRDRRIPLEGITHLCYNVPDPAKETAHLLERGCPTVLSFTRGDTILENYIDTRKYGHVIVSFRPPVERWEKAWTAHNLAHPLLKEWEFLGMGIAVRDLDQTVDYYRSLEIAEFQPEGSFDSEALEEVAAPGGTPRPAVRARTRAAQIGSVTFELVQPLDGEAIFGDSLATRGEGVCDLFFAVNDLEKEIADLAARDVKVALAGRPQEGPPFAYLDTREGSGNIMVRLIESG